MKLNGKTQGKKESTIGDHFRKKDLKKWVPKDTIGQSDDQGMLIFNKKDPKVHQKDKKRNSILRNFGRIKRHIKRIGVELIKMRLISYISKFNLNSKKRNNKK